MRNPKLRLICLGVLWAVGLGALPYLPNPSPIHWNAAGEVDGYGSPLVAALLTPAIGALLVGLAPLLPRLDPRGRNYTEFRGTYELIMNGLLLFLTALQLVTIAFALGWPVSVPRVIGVGVGLLFALIGNELGRVQPNYFVGVRTPWTLADPEVWRRTHRVGGRVFAGVGVLIAVSSLLLPLPPLAALVIAGAIGVTVFLFGYSYWVWRRRAQGAGAP
jgi:uncharacterized membrane protein